MARKDYALITGAGKGLGKAFAEELAIRNYNVLLTALPGENLETYCQYLSVKYSVDTDFIECDLTEKEEIMRVVCWVKENYLLSVLINNVGIGGTAEFEKAEASLIDTIIQLDIRATALFTHELLPLLRVNESSWILNVSSMAAFTPLGYKTVYPASKDFVRFFSKGLYQELKGTGVFVSVVYPGPMTTHFDSMRRIIKQGTIAKMSVLSAQYTAKKTIESLFKKRTHIIIGKGNKFNRLLTRIVPVSLRCPMLTRIIWREIKEEKQVGEAYESVGDRSK
ncbi:MAG TPA: SDR family NAD(P)-dependent oxidoreductase [Chitinophagaceae bacterium]|nr:SDR family NAD(P)-dependent oxidoreductase [Chitinophagaceae bacterium]